LPKSLNKFYRCFHKHHRQNQNLNNPKRNPGTHLNIFPDVKI
jgi:hypothetical protein